MDIVQTGKDIVGNRQGAKPEKSALMATDAAACHARPGGEAGTPWAHDAHELPCTVLGAAIGG
jgi:hypothetical protein